MDQLFFTITFLFLALFYRQIKKNIEAILLDAFGLVMSVVGVIITIINKIKKWLWRRTIN